MMGHLVLFEHGLERREQVVHVRCIRMSHRVGGVIQPHRWLGFGFDLLQHFLIDFAIAAKRSGDGGPFSQGLGLGHWAGGVIRARPGTVGGEEEPFSQVLIDDERGRHRVTHEGLFNRIFENTLGHHSRYGIYGLAPMKNHQGGDGLNAVCQKGGSPDTMGMHVIAPRPQEVRVRLSESTLRH